MNSLCSFVFDDTTSDLLGSASICTTEGNILTIWLAGDVKVRAGRHALTLNEPNALFTSAFGLGSPGGAPIFSGALQRIAPCANCSASAIDLRLLVSHAALLLAEGWLVKMETGAGRGEMGEMGDASTRMR